MKVARLGLMRQLRGTHHHCPRVIAGFACRSSAVLGLTLLSDLWYLWREPQYQIIRILHIVTRTINQICKKKNESRRSSDRLPPFIKFVLISHIQWQLMWRSNIVQNQFSGYVSFMVTILFCEPKDFQGRKGGPFWSRMRSPLLVFKELKSQMFL